MRILLLLLLSFSIVISYSQITMACNAITPISGPNADTDIDPIQITGYYDLRDRSSHVQITNTRATSSRIHVQIFQNDRSCNELDFFDELTANDTVVYDLDNIIKNDGSTAPINLNDDSFGYVVITAISLTDDDVIDPQGSLIGNTRIIDGTSYEYRTNMLALNLPVSVDPITVSAYIANFNTVDGANHADIVGYAFLSGIDADGGALVEHFSASVVNHDAGFTFDIFVYDLGEEPLSCDQRNFACGNVMNYGINEDYLNSRGGPLLCPGGGLADSGGGVVNFRNINDNIDTALTNNVLFVGFIGINNNNGTGSMDAWITDASTIVNN